MNQIARAAAGFLFHDGRASSRGRMGVRVAGLACAVLALAALATPWRTGTSTTFAARVAALSERGGYFDTDNLVSNESSYLQVLPDLARRGVRGGAYVGVGPDQNFTYIAAVRPSIAFIVDVRRDNLLLHLLFKAIFRLSETRVDYLALLLGRPVPPDLSAWSAASIDRLADYMDRPARPPSEVNLLRARIDRVVRDIGIPLSRADLETIDRFHRRFIEEGLSLRFQSTGRAPRSYYPTYRQLLTDRDPMGTPANYLASEEAFQFVRSLENRDLVVPVVGDFAGPTSLRSIGRLLADRGERVSAVYASNVEFYLFGQGAFPAFAANLRALPHDSRSAIIRASFGRYAFDSRRANDDSVTTTQRIDDLLDAFQAGRLRRYGDLLELSARR